MFVTSNVSFAFFASTALASFVSSTSARAIPGSSKLASVLLEKPEPPQLWQAERPKRPAEPGPHKLPKPDAKRYAETHHVDRGYIWRHQSFDADIARTAFGWPYVPRPMEVVGAEEEGLALPPSGKRTAKESAANKEAKVLARTRELLAQLKDHQGTAEGLSAAAKVEARKKHLQTVLKVPLDAPVESAQEECTECAQAPWPPHEEEAPPLLTSAATRGEAQAAQGEKEDEHPKKEGEDEGPKTEAKMNSFYVKKLQKMFAGLDFDGDEALAEEEMYAFFDAAWAAYDSTELLQKFFAEADKDHDRRVSSAEWFVFAHEAQQSSQSKAEWWDPLEHLKRNARSHPLVDDENYFYNEQPDSKDGYYGKIITRLFQVMDVNKNDVATKSEMQGFLDRKYHTKDPIEFSEKVLAEADTDGDSNITIDEFMNFAAESRKMSMSQQERWNPLLHIISNVRRNTALDTVR